MRNAPVILPVFTTSVPLDFPSEGTFAFNKKTNKQLEVTVRINEHQYFNMNFLNHDGYIMACCRWAHVLDFAENGYDRYEQIIKKHFRKKYPVISSLYGQHTDTAEDIHISTIGFEGNPKEWYISMRIYGEKFDDLLHGNLLMNVAFASAVGNLCMASLDVFKEIMKSDAKQPKILLKELTNIDEIDKNFDFGNYLDARNPETGEIISTAREDGKASGIELPEEIEMPQIWRKWDTTYLEDRMKQEDEITAKVEADQALVKKKSAEWKAIMEGMSFNAFLVFHKKMNELMKTKKATLVKYGFLASEMLDNHKRYWASSYYWHNKEYDEQEYIRYRKQTEIIVTIFYEGILRGTQYGNHPRTKYALKIHCIIEELMNKDWSKVNETLK